MNRDSIVSLIAFACTMYFVYLMVSVADYINAYPFNGGWPF